jgi:uncharacterized protein (TIGR00369 family)
MDFPRRVPFVEAQGFELLAMGGGEAELAVTLRADQGNSFGVAHGGLTMTLLDTAMAHAALSAHRPPVVNGEPAGGGPGVVTVEMKTSFLQPGQGRLLARARLLHRTATLAFCEATVSGPAGQLCAHASGTFKYLRALPTGRREVQVLAPPDSAGSADPDSPSGPAPTPFQGHGSD